MGTDVRPTRGRDRYKRRDRRKRDDPRAWIRWRERIAICLEAQGRTLEEFGRMDLPLERWFEQGRRPEDVAGALAAKRTVELDLAPVRDLPDASLATRGAAVRVSGMRSGAGDPWRWTHRARARTAARRAAVAYAALAVILSEGVSINGTNAIRGDEVPARDYGASG